MREPESFDSFSYIYQASVRKAIYSCALTGDNEYASSRKAHIMASTAVGLSVPLCRLLTATFLTDRAILVHTDSDFSLTPAIGTS